MKYVLLEVITSSALDFKDAATPRFGHSDAV